MCPEFALRSMVSIVAKVDLMSRETDYYHLLVGRLVTALRAELPSGFSVTGVSNQDGASSLPRMLDALAREDSGFSIPDGLAVPAILPDIVIAVRSTSGSPLFVLVEVKYSNQLRLMDYSQLAGYLLTAPFIPIGLLLLVSKPGSLALLSPELNQAVVSGHLPSSWAATQPSGEDIGCFRHGIIGFRPGGDLTWFRGWSGAISSTAEFAEALQGQSHRSRSGKC